MDQVTAAWAGGFLLVALCAGCGGGNDGSDRDAAAPDSTAPPTTAATVESSDKTVALESTAGGATFAVDGRVLEFEALPSGHNYYTSMASQVTARPKVDAAEQLSITFMSIDLQQLEYPVELPNRSKPGTLLDPLAAMAGVGFSYRTEDGSEWAGPGRVRIDRYGRDGVIAGSFDGVSLPHTDNQLPSITLTGGRFSARISEPW